VGVVMFVPLIKSTKQRLETYCFYSVSYYYHYYSYSVVNSIVFVLIH
jgi:hypothetical protein